MYSTSLKMNLDSISGRFVVTKRTCYLIIILQYLKEIFINETESLIVIVKGQVT